MDPGTPVYMLGSTWALNTHPLSVKWLTSIKETHEYTSTARAEMKSGSEETDSPIFTQGHDSVAKRRPAAASRYFYGGALTTAEANRRFNIMSALLERISEFSLEDLTKTLEFVCGWGSEENLKTILKYDGEKLLGFQQYSSGLNEAALRNNGRVVLYWLEEYPEHHNLVVDPATVIDVVGNGLVDILSPLINALKSTDSCETILNQALQVASTMGHQEVVKNLVKEGADVNAIVEEALRNSGEDRYNGSRSTRKVSALQAALIGFERFAPENHYKDAQSLNSGWQGADASSQQQCIEILLANGADPNRADGYERYPLSIAATYGTVETVEKLISCGAHVGKSTKEHGTALQAAAGRMYGSLPIVKVLLDASASESPVDSGKLAALDEALSCLQRYQAKGVGHKMDNPASIRGVFSNGPGAVVRIFLANLPDQKTDASRYSLLAQMACIIGDQDCVELLIQRGMDVNCCTSHHGTLLQAASCAGNMKIAECLFKAGADVNIVHGVDSTALRAAVLGGHEDLVSTLIARGADVNLRFEGEDDSILLLALRLGNPTILKALLAARPEMNINPFDQEHILITACRIGDAAMVETLLASTFDSNVLEVKSNRYSWISNYGASSLNAACSGGHLSVARLLLDYGADVEKTNESSATPLMVAVCGDHLPVVRLLLEAGANVYHAIHAVPLSEAAKEDQLEIIEEPLSIGAIIDRPSIKNNALAEARCSRNRIIPELLIESLSGTRHEAQVCSETFSAAMKRGDGELACLLLEHGVPRSFQMLRQACAAGTLKTVRMLVDSDVKIDQDDGIDAPLIHIAASRSNRDIVQFLIDRGANVLLRSEKYGSPLIAALEGTMASFFLWSRSTSCQSLAKQLPLYLPGHWSETASVKRSGHHKKPGYKEECEQIVLSLFNAGAEMDTTIRSFGNALHLASYMGSEVIVRQMLERMENVNIFGGYFESPLIAGVKGNNNKIVELLLNRDIDVNRPSPEHGSALHAACAQGRKKMIQTLLDHGADVNAYAGKHGSVLATAASPPPTSYAVFSKIKRTIVELLLRHEPKVQIGESDLLAAASWTNSYFGVYFTISFLNSLSSNGRTVEFTSKTRETLDELLHETRWRRIFLLHSQFEGEAISEEKTREKFYRLEKRHS